MHISEQINELPEQLKTCVDLLQDGNLIGCLHTIISVGKDFKDMTYDKNVLENQKKLIEQQYDQMHSTLSKQIFDLKTDLSIQKQTNFDQNQTISELNHRLQNNKKELDSLNSTLSSLRDSLGNDLNNSHSQIQQYKELLLKSQAQLTIQQHKINQLQENVNLLNQNQLSTSVLRNVETRESGNQSPNQSQQNNPGRDFSQQFAPELINNSTSIDQILLTTTTQQTDSLDLKSTETQTNPPLDPTNLFISPINLSNDQLTHLTLLLQEELFNSRNLLSPKFESQNDNFLQFYMQLDKLEAVKILLSENENLKAICRNQQFYRHFQPVSRDENKLKINELEAEISNLQAKINVIEQCQQLAGDQKLIVYWQSLSKIYENIFIKGVKIQLAHLNFKQVQAAPTVIGSGKLKLKQFLTQIETKDLEKKFNHLLSFLMEIDSEPSNSELLHEQLIVKNQQIQHLQTQLSAQNDVINRLKQFTVQLKQTVEKDLISIKKNLEEHFPLQKQDKLQLLVKNQNILIKDMKVALELYDVEKAHAEVQATSDETILVIQKNIKLQQMYDEIKVKNQQVTQKLTELLGVVGNDKKKRTAQYQFIVISVQSLLENFVKNNQKIEQKLIILDQISLRIAPLQSKFIQILASQSAQNIKLKQYRNTLNEFLNIDKKQQSTQVEQVQFADFCTQNESILSEKFTQPDLVEALQFDQQTQAESLCEYCAAAREIYAEIGNQNGKLTAENEKFRARINAFQGEIDRFGSEKQVQEKKFLLSKAMLKKVQKESTKCQIECKTLRKRVLEVTASNSEISAQIKETKQKNQFLTNQINAMTQDHCNAKKELQVLSASYEEVFGRNSDLQKKWTESEKKLAISKEEMLKQRVNAREALQMSKKSGEQLEKSLGEVKKWRSKYLNLKEKVPKSQIDQEKMNALSSLLSDDDIKSIYDCF